jgi:C1A family cysteine protease
MKKIFSIIVMMFLIGTICSTIGICQQPNIDKSRNSILICNCGSDQEKDSPHQYIIMIDPIIVESDQLMSDTSHYQIHATPDTFSWKNVDGIDWTTPSKHQKNCGSCWDFAAIGALESTVKIMEDCEYLNPDFSEQYVLSCLPDAANTYGKGCWGGNPSRAYYYIIDTGPDGNFHNGIIPESCFPYQMSHDIPCEDKCPQWLDYLVPLTNTSELWLGYDSIENREIIKSQILLNGPVAAGMNVSDEFVEFFQIHQKETDYFPDPHMPWGNRLNHIIVIVGWKDDPSITNGGYWICKNSWGSDWGYDGFYNIEYGALFTGFLITWAEYDPLSYDWPPVSIPGPYHEVSINEEIMFDASKSTDPEGEIIVYHWDFGDGMTSNMTQVMHDYDTAGLFFVNLTVTDSANQSTTATTIVGVDDSPFEISISGGLGFEVIVHNLIDRQLDMLSWDVDIKGLVAVEKSLGYIYKLAIDQYKIISVISLGFGPGKITFNCNGFSISRWFLILGPFVIVLPF